MTESEFLERVNDASRNVLRQLKATNTVHSAFNWHEQSVMCARAAQLISNETPHELAELICGVVRRLARGGCAFAKIDFESDSLLRQAWEMFDEAQRQERT